MRRRSFPHAGAAAALGSPSLFPLALRRSCPRHGAQLADAAAADHLNHIALASALAVLPRRPVPGVTAKTSPST